MRKPHRLSALASIATIATIDTLVATPLFGQSKPAKKAAAPAAAPGANFSVSPFGIVDRRTSSDFPTPRLEMTLKLEGPDANAVQAARARITKAEDDTGRNLADKPANVAGGEDWRESREGEPPAPAITLSSPTRKAKTLAVEGTLEAYLPSRDPGALVKIEKIMAKKDKPAVAIPALAKEKIKLQVLSKEVGSLFERLFMMVGENDLILKVDDPGKKIFSFGLVGPDGAAMRTYGTTDMESYRILRIFEPIPEGATLEVRLKTAKSFAEIPFKLTEVKLP